MLKPWAMIVLALLAVPRAVLHDLDVIHERTFVNLLFVFVPLLAWVAAAVLTATAKPFLSLLIVGAIYGLGLALTHQIFWDHAITADAASRAPEVVLRAFAFVSSLFTGLLTGAVTGLIAWGLDHLRGRRSTQ
ncbi:hypothetical protein AB0M54_10010 [Actinoplanes sp. NPDC051470]|uniref:hypothetical protein n=1 Tax=unclassified Actinoplanes TaxID=2626549 RepID=UPI00344636CC